MPNEGIEFEKIGDAVVPVNVVMGELGSGKTTFILSLVRQIAGDDYKVVWLKNEYGDVNVDGKLAEAQGIKTEEIMNGCVCCTAVGQLEDAVVEVLKMGPDRLIVETAGTAHPAPIAMELKRFPNLLVDSFVEVIDAVNFGGYADRTVVGRSHGQYVDLLVINKVGLVDERRLDKVLDDVYENYPNTPLVKTEDGGAPADLVIGLDHAAVARLDEAKLKADAHSDEAHVRMESFSFRTDEKLDPQAVEKLVEELPVSDIYRSKGVVRTPDGWRVLNGVANRVTWQPIDLELKQSELLFIGPYAEEHAERVRLLLEECLILP
jgi:G3E family GTPase